MAKMIPNYINQENSRLAGERMVFSWLAKEEVKGVVMHSLLQKNHKRKLIGEVDFFYICEYGILCIEVKGGGIFRSEGKWYSRDRKGEEHKIKNPFIQAKDCKYATDQYLRGIKDVNRPLVGYAVVLPHCKFTGSGNDIVTEALFDANKDSNEFGDEIIKIMKFWRDQEISKHGYEPRKLSNREIERYTDLFRGNFNIVPSMNLELQYIDEKMIELTEEQVDIIDIAENNDQVIIEGVAGTGKTLLALERARVCLAQGKKIGYICFNRNMAKYVAMNLPCDIDGSYIGTFHRLFMDLLEEDSYDLKVNILAEKVLLTDLMLDKYDYLIIDEAQDLMHVEVIDALDKCLVGGLEKGKWVMFLDPNQNIFNNSENYNNTWEYIKELYSPTIDVLKKNCRNTEQIARRTSNVAKVPAAKYMRISGPKVEMSIYSSQKEFIKELRRDINNLLMGGTPASDIVILSRYKKENSLLSEVDSLCNHKIAEPSDISYRKDTNLNYYTIHSYKGLESKVVFMIDMEGFQSVNDRILNYVGMSRARILLYTYVPIEQYDTYVEVVS